MDTPGGRAPDDGRDTPAGRPTPRPDDSMPASMAPHHDPLPLEPGAEHERVDAYAEQLRSDERPEACNMPPEHAGIYQAVAMLRALAPEAAEPTPAFAAHLWQRLADSASRDRIVVQEQPATPSESAAMPQDGTSGHTRPQVTRRGVLAGGLAAAASLAAGVTAGVTLERLAAGEGTASTTATPWGMDLVPQGHWVSLFAADTLAVGDVRRFVAATVVGFVRRTAAGFEALSGACTHMGCLLAWNASARTYDCPCHGGRFLENGQSAPLSSTAYRPLPTIATRVDAGMVWVYLPDPHGSPGASTTAATTASDYRG